jgi:hypothetical protein
VKQLASAGSRNRLQCCKSSSTQSSHRHFSCLEASPLIYQVYLEQMNIYIYIYIYTRFSHLGSQFKILQSHARGHGDWITAKEVRNLWNARFLYIMQGSFALKMIHLKWKANKKKVSNVFHTKSRLILGVVFNKGKNKTKHNPLGGVFITLKGLLSSPLGQTRSSDSAQFVISTPLTSHTPRDDGHPWRPVGLWDVKDLTLSRQSAHRWR